MRPLAFYLVLSLDLRFCLRPLEQRVRLVRVVVLLCTFLPKSVPNSDCNAFVDVPPLQPKELILLLFPDPVRLAEVPDHKRVAVPILSVRHADGQVVRTLPLKHLGE